MAVVKVDAGLWAVGTFLHAGDVHQWFEDSEQVGPIQWFNVFPTRQLTGEQLNVNEARMEVTEVFYLRKAHPVGQIGELQINIVLLNMGAGSDYELWGARTI